MVFIQGTSVFLFSSDHFKTFYPSYGPKVQKLLDTNCTAEFAAYENKTAVCTPEWLDFGWELSPLNCASYLLLNCILEALPDTAKADMASAGTFLGLLPVILAMIGSTTADVGLLTLRRPLLGAILGLASLAVDPMRFIHWRDPFEILRVHKSPSRQNLSKDRWKVGKSIVEYLLAILALGNLVGVAVDLTRKAIVGNQPGRDYQVTVWALWAFALHLAGYIALLWKVHLVTERTATRPSWRTLLRSWTKDAMGPWLAFLKSWTKDAMTPCASQTHAKISIKPATNKFIGLAWAASLATVVHIAYGSQNFSQMLFLSGGEGMIVLCRCMASVVLCRIILVYELQGMSRTVTIEDQVADGHGGRHGSVNELQQFNASEGSNIALLKTAYQPVNAYEGV